MNVLCLIYQPPECIVYLLHLVQKYPSWNFKIVYFKNNFVGDKDNLQIINFWKQKSIETFMLDSANEVEYRKKIEQLILANNFDLITGYNVEQASSNKNYTLINNIFEELKLPKIYYGTWPNYANEFGIYEQDQLDIETLPLYKQFLSRNDLKTWRYLITEEAQEDVIDPWLWNKTFYGKT